MNYQLDAHAQQLMGQYREWLPVYESLAQKAGQQLRQVLEAGQVEVITLDHRVKTEASLAGKLELKGAKYPSLDHVTDIVGLRVVTFYSADVDKVAAIVNEAFVVDWSNSVDKRKALRLDSFGYNSLHFICRLKKTADDTQESPLLYKLPFEIQMRTALQHVWSTLVHDTAYKDGGVKVPYEYLRQFNRLAGMLELIDEEFSRLRNVLTDYRRKMLALEARGQLDELDLNADTFRRYLELHPFERLNERIASVNKAELYPAVLMPFLRVFQKLGLETIGDVSRLIEQQADDAYRLAASQLGATDLDILSENIGALNLCFVYVLKRGGGPAELCQIYDWLNGYDSGNMAIAKSLFDRAQHLSFMQSLR